MSQLSFSNVSIKARVTGASKLNNTEAFGNITIKRVTEALPKFRYLYVVITINIKL